MLKAFWDEYEKNQDTMSKENKFCPTDIINIRFVLHSTKGHAFINALLRYVTNSSTFCCRVFPVQSYFADLTFFNSELEYKKRTKALYSIINWVNFLVDWFRQGSVKYKWFIWYKWLVEDYVSKQVHTHKGPIDFFNMGKLRPS
jgi:hypothetical protein